MRRIRTPGSGETVVLDATSSRKRSRSGFASMTIEIPRSLVGESDIRKVLDVVRLELLDKLRGESTPKLRNEWSLPAIEGSEVHATAEIHLTSRNAEAYLGRIADGTIAVVVPKVLRKWAPTSVGE